MEAGIKISNEKSAEAIEAMGKAIERIFASAFESHVDQETIQKALETLLKGSCINGTQISNCFFTSDSSKKTGAK